MASSSCSRRLFARTIDSMTLEKWERITNIPLFILSAVFLFAYSWQILATVVTVTNAHHSESGNVVIVAFGARCSAEYSASAPT